MLYRTKNISTKEEKMRKKPSIYFIRKKKNLAEKPSQIDDDITEISQRIMMVELETASSKDLSEAKYAKKILQLSDLDYTKNLLHEIESVPSRAERVIEKRAVIKALLLSTWLQRLYFIIRAALMSILGGVVTFFYVSFFGQIGVVLAVIMGVLIFIVGLIVTRLFDTQIVKATKYIVRRWGHHKKIREFIMNHF
jgi:ABC-type multidrug transport system fused ATPase/permease subunit